MIPPRPRIRPTISRRIKYIGIAPAAERKLGREARRGSHDLRRLVGHANFLDVLSNNLQLDAEDDEDDDDDVPSPDVRSAPELVESDDSSDDTASDSDEWSDASDDEGHELVRTVSRPISDIASARNDIHQSLAAAEDGGDYFSRARYGEVKIKLDGISNLMSAAQVPADEKKDRDVNVTVISSPTTPESEGDGSHGSSRSRSSSRGHAVVPRRASIVRWAEDV